MGREDKEGSSTDDMMTPYTRFFCGSICFCDWDGKVGIWWNFAFIDFSDMF